MNDIKRRLEWFAFYDHTGIQTHLERMAEKGWMLEQPGSYLWRYRRIPPQKLRFAVTYFPDASEFDPGPTEGQQVLQDYCEAAGWHHVARWAQMQIFCTADQDPIPLDTDAVIQVDTIHTAMKKASLPNLVLMVLLSVLQLVLQCWNFSNNPIQFLSSPSRLYMVPSWLLLLFISLCELAFYFRWHKRAREAAESTGEFLPIRTKRVLSGAITALALTFAAAALLLQGGRGIALITGLWAIGMAGMYFLTNSIKITLKKMNASRRVNRTITLLVCVALAAALAVGLVSVTLRGIRSHWLDEDPPVETYEYKGMTWEIYHDDIPLRIEDLMDTDYTQWSTQLEESSSFLISFREYTQRPRMDALYEPDLEYDILDIKVPALYGVCKTAMLERYWYGNQPEEYRPVYHLQEDLSDLADEVYRYYRDGTAYDRYLLCWADRIVEIHFDAEPTLEQLTAAVEILKNA